MNDDLFVKSSEQPEESWETTVRETAREFAYPSTPDIAYKVQRRLVRSSRSVAGLLKMAAAVVVAFIIVIATVPEARAFVVEIIRIGAIQIFIGQPTPTPTQKAVVTGTPTFQRPQALYIASALQMPNETTFEEAVTQLQSPIQLPTYPDGIGKPDHVYVQPMGQAVLVTLVWMTPGQPDHVWMTLDVLNDSLIANKFIDNDGQYHNVQVNKTAAQWLTGLHQIGFFGDDMQIFRQVNGNVLIWVVGQYGKLTYRLEGASSQAEAIHIAESFRDLGTP